MDYAEFSRLVVGLFARYPSAQLSEATVPAWWSELRVFPREALIEAFRRAPRGSPQFCPSCELVREHAEAVAKSLRGPKPDYSRPALPEALPEVPTEIRSEFEHITAQVRNGALDGAGAAKAYIRAITRGLE